MNFTPIQKEKMSKIIGDVAVWAMGYGACIDFEPPSHPYDSTMITVRWQGTTDYHSVRVHLKEFGDLNYHTADYFVEHTKRICKTLSSGFGHWGNCFVAAED